MQREPRSRALRRAARHPPPRWARAGPGRNPDRDRVRIHCGAACNPPPDGRYRAREVGGGRSTRQPGQVRKEAALTRIGRVSVQPPTCLQHEFGSPRAAGHATGPRRQGPMNDQPTFDAVPPPPNPADEPGLPGFAPAAETAPRLLCASLKLAFRSRARQARRPRAAGLSRAGAEIPPAEFRRPDRPGRDGAHAAQRVRVGPHSAGVDPHRRPRRGQDDDGAHPGARAQLPAARRLRRTHGRSPRRGRALPLHHGIASCRRAGDGRRVPHLGRRRAGDHRRHPLRPGLGALQGLHHRRGPHALGEGVQRLPEDAGGAAAARQVRVRDHRDPQGAGDDPVALPALRPAPHRRFAAGEAPRQYLRPGRRGGGAGGAGDHRAGGRGLGARFAVAARPGDRPRRGAHRRRDRARHDGPGGPGPRDRPLRGRHARRRRRPRCASCATSTIPGRTRWWCSPTSPSSCIS